MVNSLRQLFVIIFILTSFCCHSPPPQEPKLLIFGIDAASWKVLDPLMSKGYLPTFESLTKTGTRSKVKTLYPTVSVMLWTTIATGMLPEHHGISNWLREGSNTSGQLAITSDLRKAPAFWNIWSRKMIVSNWWATWPAEKINGVMISNRTHFQTLKNLVYPKSAEQYIKTIPFRSKKALESYLTKLNPYHNQIELTDFMFKQLQRDRYYLDFAYTVYSDNPSDILALFVRGIDVLEHEYLEDVLQFPNAPKLDKTQKGIVISYYRYLDEQINRFMKLLGPNLNVIILSDHGMEPMIKRPPFLEGLNISKLFETLSKIPNNSLKGYYVDFHDNMNYPPGLKRGLSWHGNQISAEILEQFKKDLGSIKIENTKLFTKIDINPNNNNELITLEINPEPTINDVIHYKGVEIPLFSVTDLILHPRAGQHWNSPDGIFLANGQGIKQNYIFNEIKIQDIMPTITMLLKEPIAEKLDGDPNTNLFTSDFLKTYKAKMIDSYQWTPSIKTQSSKSVDNIIRNELRSLGYIQ